LGCAEFARHESLKRARTRHRNTVGARRLHCLRQRNYRQRQGAKRGQDKQRHQPPVKSGTGHHNLVNSEPEETVALNSSLEIKTMSKQSTGQDAGNDFVKTILQAASCNNALSVETTTKFDLSSVTDHGSPFGTGRGIVMTAAITKSHRQSKPNKQSDSGKVQCDICGAWCGPFARRKPWHRGRRWTNTQRGKP